MGDQAFSHLVLNLHGRIQRRHRLLIDHRNIRAAQFSQISFGSVAELLTLEEDVAALYPSVGSQKIDDGIRRRAFATA